MAREGGSATKRIKTSEKNTLNNDALNALIMILVKGPQLATIEAKELIKHIAKIYRERKQYEKTPSIKRKEQETQTDSKYTHVTLCAESEFAKNVEERLDVITPEKHIISSFNKTSEI